MISLPTLIQLQTSILNDLQTEYGVNISNKQRVALAAVANTQAGKLWQYYKFVAFTQKNIWPDTADTEANGGTLERFGRVRLGRNPYQPVSGQYIVTVTGTTGAVLTGQTTVFKSNDDSLNPGILYVLDNTFIMTGSSNTITIRCLTAGEAGRLAIGNTLTLTSPIALVNSVVTVSTEAIQPLNGESIENYRNAILNSFRLEAQGGAATDYRIWAQDAQGEKQVYVYAKSGESNANNIYVEATIADSIDGKGTPTQAILDAVRDAVNFSPDTSLSINERGRRPNTVREYYLPVSPKNVEIIITGGTFSTSQKSDILSAMTISVNAIRPFVAAADLEIKKNDILDTNKLNGVIYSAVPGAVYTGVTLKVAAATLLTYTFINGNIPFLLSVTYA